MQKLFISGIKSKTGKTLVSAGIAGTMQGLSYSVSYYKPVQTSAQHVNGIKQTPDLDFVKYIDPNIKVSSTYAFPSSNSPIVAAYEENSKIDLDQICKDYELNSQMREFHIIEGSNSVSTPIDERYTECDLIKKLGASLVLVINPKVSPLEETIMAIQYIKNSKVRCNGIILTNYNSESSNLEEKYYPQLVRNFTDFEIIGVLPDYSDIKNVSPEVLIEDVINNIDLEKVFNVIIQKLSNRHR